MIKILIVEDEAIIALMLKKYLTSQNYNVVGVASSGEEAIEKAKDLQPGILLMDFKIAGEINGIEAMKEIRKFLHVPVIFITGNSNLNFSEELSSQKEVQILGKPIDFSLLNFALAESLQLS